MGMDESRFSRLTTEQTEEGETVSSQDESKDKTKSEEAGVEEDSSDEEASANTAPRGRPSRNRDGVRSVFFLNNQQAWTVGAAGSIHRTDDGGSTWKRQNGGARYNDLRHALFLDENNGWVSGSQGILLETQDQGKTWLPLNSGTRQELVGVHFVGLDPKWGWVMRRDGTVHYTTDGDKWSAGRTPIRPPLFDNEPPRQFRMNDVGFGKFSEGWAAGGDGQIIHNQDGGPIWTPQRTSTGKDLVDIQMKFAPLDWAVGHAGIVQRTVNGGQYWKPMKRIPDTISSLSPLLKSGL